eukprot:GHVN01066532.1.p1 GENE.GHVN01066532.1~~GHVN01066532.1.p1  ORF type:complete len:372 (-),score=56.82 GHVN01066532.1:96-1211(-)
MVGHQHLKAIAAATSESLEGEHEGKQIVFEIKCKDTGRIEVYPIGLDAKNAVVIKMDYDKQQNHYTARGGQSTVGGPNSCFFDAIKDSLHSKKINLNDEHNLRARSAAKLRGSPQMAAHCFNAVEVLKQRNPDELRLGGANQFKANQTFITLFHHTTDEAADCIVDSHPDNNKGTLKGRAKGNEIGYVYATTKDPAKTPFFQQIQYDYANNEERFSSEIQYSSRGTRSDRQFDPVKWALEKGNIEKYQSCFSFKGDESKWKGPQLYTDKVFVKPNYCKFQKFYRNSKTGKFYRQDNDHTAVDRHGFTLKTEGPVVMKKQMTLARYDTDALIKARKAVTDATPWSKAYYKAYNKLSNKMREPLALRYSTVRK